MNKVSVQDVITDGSNTQVLCDDETYEKQLIGSVQNKLQKAMNKFIELPLSQKEAFLTRLRAAMKELEL
jgi:hypothetical protein